MTIREALKDKNYDIKRVKRDGVDVIKLRCPVCGMWGDIDDDQYHGRISVYHNECSFHETIDFSQYELRTRRY